MFYSSYVENNVIYSYVPAMAASKLLQISCNISTVWQLGLDTQSGLTSVLTPLCLHLPLGVDTVLFLV